MLKGAVRLAGMTINAIWTVATGAKLTLGHSFSLFAFWCGQTHALVIIHIILTTRHFIANDVLEGFVSLKCYYTLFSSFVSCFDVVCRRPNSALATDLASATSYNDALLCCFDRCRRKYSMILRSVVVGVNDFDGCDGCSICSSENVSDQ